MILVAGLTPAWQKIMSYDQFRVGEVNRARRVDWCASGKGLNVAKALHELCPGQSHSLSFVGGASGEAIRQEFVAENITATWVESTTPTRTCTTILDLSTQVTTELVENSASVTSTELDSFRQQFTELLADAEFVVITGSLPDQTPATFYKELLESCSVPVILDIRGPELQHALEQKPFLVKPNREELALTLGKPIATEDDLINGMRKLNQQGAEWVVVSQGADETWATSATKTHRFVPVKTKVVNPIGCGDCLAAGIAWGMQQGHSIQDAIRCGMAAASVNLEQLLPARLNRDLVTERAKIRK